MNVILVSDNSLEAELLKRELLKSASGAHIDVCPNAQDALARAAAGECDAILLDSTVPSADAVNLVVTIRSEKKSIGIVALVGAAEKELPTELYNVGVDRFIMKRPGFAALLGEALQQAKERHRAESASRSRQARVLYAGNMQNAKRHLSALPHLLLEPLEISAEGVVQLPDSGPSPGDLIIVDSAVTGAQTLKAIKDICLRAPDIPTILLSNPGDEEAAVQAMKLGAADCIVKTQNYVQRLLPAIEREIGRRELAREKAVIRSREDRLRQIVESMPVGVTVIAPDGTFLAINRAGLKLMGAAHIEQIIGKNLIHLLPHEERERTLAFLTTVCGWTSATIRLEWKGLDGTVPGIELRAVPMRREGAGTATVLAAIHAATEQQSGQGVPEEVQKKCEDLSRSLREYEVRFRELQEKYSLQQSKWETALRQVDARRAAAEEQYAKLKSTAEENANRFKLILEEQRAERANWEQSRQSLKEQCAKIEVVAQSMKAAQASLVENHNSEQAQWNAHRQELEQKLEAAEENIAQLSEALRNERSQLSIIRQETEQKFQSAEQQRIELESSLHEAEARLSQQIEEQDARYSQLDNVRRELEKKFQTAEQQRLSLEIALREAEMRIAQQSEERNAERSQLETMRQELEQKFQSTEQQRAELESAFHQAETRINRQAEERAAERSQLESARQELEQKFRDAEKQRVALEGALGAAQARSAQQAEEISEQRSKLDAARRELEQKFQDAENKRAELEAALHEAEERINRQAEKYSADTAQQDLARSELESQFREVREQHTELQTALSKAEARLTQIENEHSIERAQWDLVRLELDRKYQIAEEQRNALQESLNKAEYQLSQKAEEQHADVSQWDQAKRELEQRIQSSEEQRSALRDALHESESSRAQQTMAYNAERAQWDQAKWELEQKFQTVEEKRAALETALGEADSQRAKQAEILEAERTERNQVKQELEKQYQITEEQRSAIEASLRETESRLAQLAEKHNSERMQWDAAKHELEERCRIAEEQRAIPEDVLKETESRLAQLVEQHNAERSQWEVAKQELEQKFQTAQTQWHSLQSKLNEADARLAQLVEKHRAEVSQRDIARKELELHHQAALEQRAALEANLRDTESRFSQLSEKHNAELSQRDFARKELELKYQATEKQRASLQTSLHEAEANLTQLVEKHSTELSQHDFAQKKAEQKFQAAEKQRIVLEKSLHDAESNIAQLTEKYNVEQAQWEQARQELEQKRQNAEKQQAAALQNAVRETESRLAWISEQNQAKATQLEMAQKELEQLQAEYNRVTAGSVDFKLRYQRLSQLTSVGVVLTQKDGLVLECNDAAARMFGYSNVEEALAQSGENRFRIYAFKGALDARLQKDGGLSNIEWSSLTHDGRLIRIQEYSTLVESPTGGGQLVERILTDITKIHKLSEEIRRTRRMESAGDLATATVKGFKELCASLAHSGELLMETPGDGDSVKRIAEALLNEANRGVKHARQFLSIANKADRTPALLNLNEILTNNDALMHSLIGEDVDLQTNLAPRIGLVSADRNEMVQLIGNLLANSREALPMGGALAIETSDIEIDSSAAGSPAGLQPGIYVRMVFSADGCAVQPERRTASIRNMIERMGGLLQTTNDPKLGNIHSVYLPRVEACAGQADLAIKTAGA
jgi:PAS domain S-box-containing protein